MTGLEAEIWLPGIIGEWTLETSMVGEEWLRRSEGVGEDREGTVWNKQGFMG